MYTLLLLLALSPVRADPADPAALATLRQETLPDLKRRTTAAKERIKDAELFFAGKAPLESAWPELIDAPLGEPGYLYSRLQALSARDEARALERVAGAPEGLPDPQVTQLDRALSEAIDAEIRADALERQLLAALVAGFKRAPELQAAALESSIAQWRETQRAAAVLDPADPASAEAIQRAGEAGEQETILRRYQQAAILAMTQPGDLSLARLVRADLTRMEGRSDLERTAALDRIRRALPLLPADLTAEAQAVLSAMEKEEIAARLTALAEEEAAALAEREARLAENTTLAELEEAQADADAALRLAREADAAILASTPVTEVERLRLTEAQQRHRILEIRAETARLRLERFREEEATRSVIAGAAQTQETVNDAQRKAEEARQRAEAAGKEELQTLIANLQALSARMAEAEDIRHAQVSDAIVRLQEEQGHRRAATEQAMGAPPALRTAELQQEYIAQLQWIEQLRRRLEERRSSARTLAEKNATVSANELPHPDEVAAAAGNDRDLTRDAQIAVEAVQEAMAERHKQASRETDAVARMLRDARADLRVIRSQLSRVDQIAAEREVGLEPVLLAAAEIADVPALVTEKYRTLQELQSWNLTNISRQILVFLIQSFNIILVLLGWHLLRNQGADWVERALRISQQIIPRSARQQRFDLWVDLDLTGLTARLTPTIRPAADALAAALIHASISEASPLLGLFTLLWLTRTLLTLTPRLIDLLVVDGSDRPLERRSLALLSTTPELHRLITRSARVLVWWWLLLRVLHYLAYDVLRADMLDAVLSSLTLLVVIGLSLRELLRWGPTIRAHVQGLGATGMLVDWMTASSSSSLLTIARALAGVLYTIAHLTTQLTAMLVEGRGGMSWIGSLIAQHSLKQLNEDCPPISDEERETIRAAHRGIFLHDDLVSSIHEEHSRWLTEQRGGMIAVIGSSGAGKSMVMQRAAARLAEGDRPIQTLRLQKRSADTAEVLAWLRDALGVSPDDSPDWGALTGAVLRREPTVFFIDDAHRLLLRAVGGFSALRRLIALIHATSSRHFWVVSFHRQTWSFLEGSAVPVSIDLFRTSLDIKPLSPARLADWLGSNTRAAGFDFDFDNLVAGAVLGADPARSLDRVKTAFWRRLSDTSEGNPQIALRYWLESLNHPTHPELEIAEEPAHSALTPLDVALYSPPFPEIIDGLSDTALFVLAAIVIHDGLSVEHLARTLNTSTGLIRATTRHLQILDALIIVDDEFHISPPWLPAIVRTLRQRHFLQSRG